MWQRTKMVGQMGKKRESGAVDGLGERVVREKVVGERWQSEKEVYVLENVWM